MKMKSTHREVGAFLRCGVRYAGGWWRRAVRCRRGGGCDENAALAVEGGMGRKEGV